MRIFLIISSLSSGGAERVMSKMANYWVDNGHEVILTTIESRESDFYSLDDRIQRFSLSLTGYSRNLIEAIYNNIKRIKSLRRIIEDSQPDVIVSFLDTVNVITILTKMGINVPLLVAVRTDPRQRNIGKIWSFLRRFLYPLADAVVVQTDGVRLWAEEFLQKQKVHVIPNPVELPKLKNLNKEINRNMPKLYQYKIIAMGRLIKSKGFDLLIRAFAECSRKFPDWSLDILGEGNEREELEKLILDLGIEEKVNLSGLIKEPESILSNAEIFVMSSLYEGFPNALLEAMACGLPVISFDCPSGPREIIRNGVDGILVNTGDIEELVTAMELLMSNESERKRLGSAASGVKDRFSLEKVMGNWESIIEQVIERRKGK